MSGRPPPSRYAQRVRETDRPARAATNFKTQLTRAELIGAALGVFQKRGVEGTRVEDLLEAAGIARRTFYKYFRNKDDVLAALYELVTRELIDMITRATLAADEAAAGCSGRSPLAGVHDVLDAYLEFHVDNHTIVRMLVEEAMRSASPLAPLRRRFREELVNALDDAFVRAGGKRVDPFVFVALVSGLEALSLEILQRKPDRNDVERVRRTMVGLLDAALLHAASLPGAPRR